MVPPALPWVPPVLPVSLCHCALLPCPRNSSRSSVSFCPGTSRPASQSQAKFVALCCFAATLARWYPSPKSCRYTSPYFPRRSILLQDCFSLLALPCLVSDCLSLLPSLVVRGCFLPRELRHVLTISYLSPKSSSGTASLALSPLQPTLLSLPFRRLA